MKRLIALMMAIMIILVGCTKPVDVVKDPNVEDGPEKVETNVPQEYNTVYSGEVTTFNYLVSASTNEFALAANMVDTLIDYDRYGVPQPSLATEWSTSDDGLVWTFKIREGVKWYGHDGKEYADVTAQDFVDSMKYILNSANDSQTANIAYGVIANAESTIMVKLQILNRLG